MSGSVSRRLLRVRAVSIVRSRVEFRKEEQERGVQTERAKN